MRPSQQSLYDMLLKSATENPHGYIYNFLGYQRSYQNFLKDVHQCACHLKGLGIGSGDIITICLPNIPRALVLFYAINKINAISNFIHPEIPIKDYEELLLKIKPKALFLLDSFKKQQETFKALNIFEIIQVLPSNEFMTLAYKCLTTPKGIYHKMTCRLTYYKEQACHESFDCQKNFKETSTILFTGGTTGISKGICLSDLNINTCAIQTGLNRENPAVGDKILAVLPIFHGYGLVSCIHTAVSQSGEILLLPYFKDKMFMKMFKSYQPNYITGIPKLYARMIPLLEKEKMDLSFLKGVFCGGSQLGESIRIQFNQVLKDHNAQVALREGYGLTEMVSACTLMPKDKHKKNSIGKPFEGVKAKILDPKTKKTMPLGQLGQIAFQSHAIMLGYYGQEDQPFSYEEDGRWLYTDDLGYMDSEGYLFFVDRLKRMLKISGYEVFPSKIEAKFTEIPGILNACLLEYLDKGLAYLKLYLVIEKGQDPKIIKDKVIKKACDDLSPWSRPKIIEFIDTIPQTLYKKNDYNKLAELNDRNINE
jgi:long-chain acyl-CoA synthetase